jgi:uncharacterized secreted protein with C-terminal beta-propeller domain
MVMLGWVKIVPTWQLVDNSRIRVGLFGGAYLSQNCELGDVYISALKFSIECPTGATIPTSSLRQSI